MQNYKSYIGNALIIIGVAVGLYCGIWWAFVGGIIVVAEELRSVELDWINMALGIARIIFAGGIGYASAFCFIIPGWLMVDDVRGGHENEV